MNNAIVTLCGGPINSQSHEVNCQSMLPNVSMSQRSVYFTSIVKNLEPKYSLRRT